MMKALAADFGETDALLTLGHQRQRHYPQQSLQRALPQDHTTKKKPQSLCEHFATSTYSAVAFVLPQLIVDDVHAGFP